MRMGIGLALGRNKRISVTDVEEDVRVTTAADTRVTVGGDRRIAA